jgi:tetraacyldisaccharide 4'-kinase
MLSFPYAMTAALHRQAYDRGLLARRRLAGPVISVGNLSAGGRGKTPAAARVARWLRDDGLAVAILSRGYGGSFRGPALFVSEGNGRVGATAAVAGDEPVMLARLLPDVVVAVGRRRDVVGRAVEARLGEHVHVLDDGFQHHRLHRDLDVVCVALADLADGTLPFGRLREPVRALGRAHVILLTGLEGAAETTVAQAERALGSDRTWRMGRTVAGVFDRAGAARPFPRRPFLLAGIAHPERFRADAAAQGGAIAGESFFRDHHPFAEGELREAARRARTAGADALLTTAKDEVRLPEIDLGLPVAVLRIEARIEGEDRLRERLRAAVRRPR